MSHGRIHHTAPRCRAWDATQSYVNEIGQITGGWCDVAPSMTIHRPSLGYPFRATYCEAHGNDYIGTVGLNVSDYVTQLGTEPLTLF